MPSWQSSKSTTRRAATLAGSAREPRSVYLHVPFCAQRCAYCSFHSTAIGDDPEVVEAYVDAVSRAARRWAEHGLLDEVVSVYIGGGTPTALGHRLPDLVRAILGSVILVHGAEVTVEANPETATPDLLARLCAEGANRLSVGVQSLDEPVLRALGRRHSPREVLDAVSHATGSGLDVSVDLMCGAPAQTLGSWRRTLRDVVALGADHVSVYPLSVEEGTPLAAAVARGSIELPDEDLVAEMMELAEELLSSAGVPRYEVASYARPGHECRHNIGYWTGRPYVGIGPSAASMLPATPTVVEAMREWGATQHEIGDSSGRVTGAEVRDGEVGRLRFTVTADTRAFIECPTAAPGEVEFLSRSDADVEDAMLGLRLTEGITDALVDRAGVRESLERLSEAGLVERAEGRWRTTRVGWLLGNDVFEAVWSSRHRDYTGGCPLRREVAWHSL